MYSDESRSKVTKSLTAVLLSALVLCLFGSMAVAQAANEATASIQRLEIAFWPEYDKPQVLVMYRGELDPSTLLPAQVALPIPAEVGTPHAVAWKNAQGGLMMAQHSLDIVDGSPILNITAPSHSFRVEYYQNIDRDGDRRMINFRWPGGPGIAELAYEIQQPLGATDLEIQPIPGKQGVSGDGLTYASAELGAVASGAPSEITFSYRKPTDVLSVSALAPSTPSPSPTSTPPAASATPIRSPASGSGITQWWPVYVAMALLVGLLAGIAMQRRKN